MISPKINFLFTGEIVPTVEIFTENNTPVLSRIYRVYYRIYVVTYYG